MSRSQSTTLETETIHRLLSNATRRAALDVLSTADRATPDELARRLARSDRDLETGGPDTTRRTVTIALVHNHLPRLDEHDVVDYRGPEATVTLETNFDDLEPFLERVGDRP